MPPPRPPWPRPPQGRARTARWSWSAAATAPCAGSRWSGSSRAAFVRPALRAARRRRCARAEVGRRPGARPGHQRGPVLQERPGGAADRLAHQADDRGRRHRGRPAARRADHDQRRRHRHREGQPVAAQGRHHAVARRPAPPGADVLGEPRRARSRPQLPGRHGGVRRRDEPQGARARHARHPLRRADGPLERQPVERPRPRHAGQGGARPPDHPRAVDLARVRGRGRQPPGPVPQHQRPGQEPGVGDRPAEDRLHLRSRPLPGDAGQAGRAPADHGVPRLGGQVLADRRRRAGAPLAHRVGGTACRRSPSAKPKL